MVIIRFWFSLHNLKAKKKNWKVKRNRSVKIKKLETKWKSNKIKTEISTDKQNDEVKIEVLKTKRKSKK